MVGHKIQKPLVFYALTGCDRIKTVLCSGDRETVLARQEFIQQLSLWDQEETDTSKQVPIPGTVQTGLYISDFI